MPTPISTRPRESESKDCAVAKIKLPAPPSIISPGTTRRGPQRSKLTPMGIWTAAKAAKNKLVIKPNSEALN
jgi:hypothetical protein